MPIFGSVCTVCGAPLLLHHPQDEDLSLNRCCHLLDKALVEAAIDLLPGRVYYVSSEPATVVVLRVSKRELRQTRTHGQSSALWAATSESTEY
jgi:hypothetical protein